MTTLDKVIRGLRNGLSYKRTSSEGVEEWVRPVWDSYNYTTNAYNRFEHTVVGPDWGGVNEMGISYLSFSRFEIDGWSQD
jgi:hypothetical protein